MTSPRPAEVVVVGNIGIDTNVYAGPETDLGALTTEGHFSSNVDYIGQAGGFTSLGFLRLRRRVAFIGHVGRDPLGRWIRKFLIQAGIDIRGLGMDPAGTARSVNLMAPDGSRINFYDGRGHADVEMDPKLAARIFSGAKLALFHLPHWARTLLPVAREAGCVIACDLQDMRDIDDEYRADFIAAADILFVSGAHQADPDPLLRSLVARSRGGMVVCGLGAKGVKLATKDGIQHFPLPKLGMPVLDTNGAGDALAAGFLTAFVFDKTSTADAVLRGQIAARWSCTIKASSNRGITPEQVTVLMAAVGRPVPAS